jgi:hypothetical protein
VADLARKLQVKPGSRVLLVNAAEGVREALEPLPDGAAVSEEETGEFDVVLAFAPDQAAVVREAGTALAAIRPGGALWFAYPKGTSGAATDLSRDRGWEALSRLGLRPVSQVAVDETWSALRFRPAADVGG